MNPCELDPSHPAEEPLAHAFRDVSDGRGRPAIDPLGRGAALTKDLEDVVHAEGPRVDRGRGPRDLVEEVAVAPSGLPDLPLAVQRAGSYVATSQGATVTRLVRGEGCLPHGGSAESGPKSERVGRDGDAAERRDPFGGLLDAKVPRDEIADSVPEDVSGLRRDFDRRDHEEAAARRRLRPPDSTA